MRAPPGGELDARDATPTERKAPPPTPRPVWSRYGSVCASAVTLRQRLCLCGHVTAAFVPLRSRYAPAAPPQGLHPDVARRVAEDAAAARRERRADDRRSARKVSDFTFPSSFPSAAMRVVVVTLPAMRVVVVTLPATQPGGLQRAHPPLPVAPPFLCGHVTPLSARLWSRYLPRHRARHLPRHRSRYPHAPAPPRRCRGRPPGKPLGSAVT
jgi:hypothetical protein